MAVRLGGKTRYHKKYGGNHLHGMRIFFQDANWYATNPLIPENSAPESNEAYTHLLKEQDEAEKSYNELQALMAENKRNLQEARRAVAEAARNRG